MNTLLLPNNVGRPKKQSTYALEWFVLAIVVFASTTLSVDSVIEPKTELEIDHIYGSITLSTRSSMNALGLGEDFDTGAIATVDIRVNSVISEGCITCENTPTGVQMNGNIIIQNIHGEIGGLGRIEGTLSITYLKEYISENFISKEWLSVEWNASGGSELDTYWEFIIIHNPPKWNLDERYNAAFISVDGNEESSISHLKAYYQKEEATVRIDVVPETDLYPTNGFAFIPPTVKLVKKKEKRLKIRLDTNIFPPGTIIELSSEDERIELPFKKISVSKPNLGKYLTEEIISPVKCDTSKIQSEIIAKAFDNTKQERTAVCKVKVVDKEENKVFFKDVRPSSDGDERKRARFADGIIYFHTKHPVLEHYFGIDSKNILDNPTKEAVAILADTVLNIALRQMAIKRIEDGSVDILDESRRDEEIELERKRLEQKFGKYIHQHLTNTYQKGKLN